MTAVSSKLWLTFGEQEGNFEARKHHDIFHNWLKQSWRERESVAKVFRVEQSFQFGSAPTRLPQSKVEVQLLRQFWGPRPSGSLWVRRREIFRRPRTFLKKEQINEENGAKNTSEGHFTKQFADTKVFLLFFSTHLLYLTRWVTIEIQYVFRKGTFVKRTEQEIFQFDDCNHWFHALAGHTLEMM